MSIQELRSFRCRQFELQTQGGFCCGISVALATHLLECGEGFSHPLSPLQVFDYVQEYMGAVRVSGNILEDTITPGFQHFRQRIFNLQSRHRIIKNPMKPFVRGCGVVLLALSVAKTRGRGNNCAYLKSPDYYPKNHMGIAFYGTGDEIFIFDPNTGGMIIRWNEDSITPTVIHALDCALLRMYKMYDRMQGIRTANVVMPQMIAENYLPFGDYT